MLTFLLIVGVLVALLLVIGIVRLVRARAARRRRDRQRGGLKPYYNE